MFTYEQRKGMIGEIGRRRAGCGLSRATVRRGLLRLSDGELWREYCRSFGHYQHNPMHRPTIICSPEAGKYRAGWLRAKAAGRDQEYINALHTRINARAGDPRPMWRKYDSDHERAWIQDRRDIQDRVQKRVQVYQLRSEECRARFAHLLSDRNE